MKSICLIDCGSSKVPDIEQMLIELNCEVSKILLADANQTDFSAYNAMIISGGPHLFTDSVKGESLLRMFDFIPNLNLPVFGICLGLQGIALNHGSKVFRKEERRETDFIQIQQKHPLLVDLPDSPIFSEDHCEGITLADGFILLGDSEFYEVEIMANDKKRLYGVQFHPEVSGKNGKILLNNFLHLF